MSGVGINPGTIAKVESFGFRQSYNLGAASIAGFDRTFDVINTEATRKTLYLGLYPERTLSQPVLAFTGLVTFLLNNQVTGEIPFTLNEVPDSTRFTFNPWGSLPYPANGIIPPDGLLVGAESGLRLLAPVRRIVHCDKIRLQVNNSVLVTETTIFIAGSLVCDIADSPPCTETIIYFPTPGVIPNSVKLTFAGAGYHDFQTSPFAGEIRSDSSNTYAGGIDYSIGRVEMTSGAIGLAQPYTGSYRIAATATSGLYRFEFYVVNEYPYS